MKSNWQKVALGSDHAGYNLKLDVIKWLIAKDIEFYDFGTFSDDRADYPDFAHTVAKNVNDHKFDAGILICGSGNGVCMTANKYVHVRAALCWNVELTRLARLHNDANILCLPGRFIKTEEALKCVETFLTTNFEGGRHTIRVKKISNIIL
ncbi:MAG: ribose 5-phosphate isomerase B [Bacteroidales bacterium]|jgi:ribose 5-phosphate isomerase B|nr:ribose 5-phosphate isomerase B [Bacteroidales bacterium]